MLQQLTQILLMMWLWCIFAGFYLVAYAFWVPGLFANPVLMIAALAATLVLGGLLLLYGFSGALALNSGRSVPHIRRVPLLVGGVALLCYVAVYLPPSGRIVAHWPLDLAITVFAGIRLVLYALVDK